MESLRRLFRTGDKVEHVGNTAREIDALISELGQLYKQRVQAMRMGTHLDIHTITTQIIAVKTRLNQL